MGSRDKYVNGHLLSPTWRQILELCPGKGGPRGEQEGQWDKSRAYSLASSNNVPLYNPLD